MKNIHLLISIFFTVIFSTPAYANQLKIDGNDYLISNPYNYIEAKRFQAGWNRGADVIPISGVVRAATNGIVIFSGSVAGKDVITVKSTLGGKNIVVTYTGSLSIFMHEGDKVKKGETIAKASSLHIGAYTSYRRSNYIPIVASSSTSVALNSNIEPNLISSKVRKRSDDPNSLSSAITKKLYQAITSTPFKETKYIFNKVKPIDPLNSYKAYLYLTTSSSGLFKEHLNSKTIDSKALTYVPTQQRYGPNTFINKTASVSSDTKNISNNRYTSFQKVESIRSNYKKVSRVLEKAKNKTYDQSPNIRPFQENNIGRKQLSSPKIYYREKVGEIDVNPLAYKNYSYSSKKTINRILEKKNHVNKVRHDSNIYNLRNLLFPSLFTLGSLATIALLLWCRRRSKEDEPTKELSFSIKNLSLPTVQATDNRKTPTITTISQISDTEMYSNDTIAAYTPRTTGKSPELV